MTPVPRRARFAVLTVLAALICGDAWADIRIVALGDSNLAGKGVRAEETYPPKLERALRARGHDVSVLNAGRNGDTTQGVLNRMDRDVPEGTRIVLLAVGANDLVVFNVPRATVVRNLDEILTRLRGRGIEVLLFGLGDPRRPECCAGAPMARNHDALFYRQFQDVVFEREDLHVERGEPIKGTNWHLTPEGYDIVVARTLPLVEQLIAKVQAAPAAPSIR